MSIIAARSCEINVLLIWVLFYSGAIPIVSVYAGGSATGFETLLITDTITSGIPVVTLDPGGSAVTLSTILITEAFTSTDIIPFGPPATESSGSLVTGLLGSASTSKNTSTATATSTGTSTATATSTKTSTTSTSTSTSTATATVTPLNLALKPPSAAIIGGSIAGSLAFLLAVGAGILFVLRRRRHTRHLHTRITPLESSLPADSEGLRNVGPGEKGRSLLTHSAYTQSDFLQTVPSAPSQDPSRSEQQMMLESEDDVRSQMASMKATMVRMIEHVQRIEAHIESDLPPPTYISS